MDSREIFEKALARGGRFLDGTHGLLAKRGGQLAEDEGALLSLFDFYQDAGGKAWKGGGGAPLFFERQGEGFLLCSGASELWLKKDDFFLYVELLSDVFLPALPLGSCVRLKAGAFSGLPGMPGDYEPEAVVVDRYLAVPEAGIYFPYTGVVYPLGAFGTERKIHFGPQLVEEVLHSGFSDEREEAFIELMKEEYILDRGLRSMGFAGEQEAEALRGMLAAAKGGG
jgi:hypothetical protein